VGHLRGSGGLHGWTRGRSLALLLAGIVAMLGKALPSHAHMRNGVPLLFAFGSAATNSTLLEIFLYFAKQACSFSEADLP